MDLLNILKYLEVIAGVVVIVTVLMQNRSGGLGSVFGGGGGELYRSKRGLEAVLYNGTVIAGTVFVSAAFAIAILSV